MLCMKQKLMVEIVDISNDWEYAMVKNKEYPNFGQMSKMEKLILISDKNPLFIGLIRYEKTVELDEINLKVKI